MIREEVRGREAVAPALSLIVWKAYEMSMRFLQTWNVESDSSKSVRADQGMKAVLSSVSKIHTFYALNTLKKMHHKK